MVLVVDLAEICLNDYLLSPDLPDNVGDANPRGLAIKFRAPGGDFDIVTVNLTVPDAATLATIESTMSNDPLPVGFSAPDYPSNGSTPNAQLQLHGSTSRKAIQKSYQVHLSKLGAAWRGSEEGIW